MNNPPMNLASWIWVMIIMAVIVGAGYGLLKLIMLALIVTFK